MITIYRWDRERQAGETLDAAALAAGADQLRSDTGVVWIDFANPGPDEEKQVFEQFFRVHPLTLEDITRLRRDPAAPPHFPKAEEFRDYLFVVINPLAQPFLEAVRKPDAEHPEAEGRATTQLSAVLTKNLLITHHFEPVVGVQELHSFLARHDSEAGRGPDYLFHIILDATVDQFVAALDHFDEALDEIEIQVFEGPRQQLLLTLLRLKREIIIVRKTLVYNREVLARLARGEFTLIAKREMAYYRNVYDHLVRFTELVETSREMVTDLMQTHLAATSNKLNEIMKVLTMISTTILPMALIASIYGMNFEAMPEYKWQLGYPYALGLMAASGLGSLLFFKWKKWI